MDVGMLQLKTSLIPLRTVCQVDALYQLFQLSSCKDAIWDSDVLPSTSDFFASVYFSEAEIYCIFCTLQQLMQHMILYLQRRHSVTRHELIGIYFTEYCFSSKSRQPPFGDKLTRANEGDHDISGRSWRTGCYASQLCIVKGRSWNFEVSYCQSWKWP